MNLSYFTKEELKRALTHLMSVMRQKETAFLSRLQPFSDKLGPELFEQKRREFTKKVGLSPTWEDDIFDLFSKFTQTTN